MAKYLTFDPKIGDTILKTPTYDKNIPFEIIQTNDKGFISHSLIPEDLVVSNLIYIEGKCLEPIDKFRAVVMDEETNKFRLFNEGDLQITGIALDNGQPDDIIRVAISGIIKDSPFLVNSKIYVTDGGLLQTQPSDTLHYQIGYVANRMLIINPQTPVILQP
jgi:hypothetical protein